jgi:hypothetical protein
MPALNQFMSRGFASPQVHGVRESARRDSCGESPCASPITRRRCCSR